MNYASFEDCLSRFDFFCFDASGVLYNKPEGLIPGVRETIQKIQVLKKEIFVVTNNSMKSSQDISDYLAEHGVVIDAERIISSGLGCCYDVKTRGILEAAGTIYISGDSSSYAYLKDLHVQRVDDLNHAKAILLMSNFNECKEDDYQELIDYLIKNPTLPVVCCNPDRYILSRGKRFPVMGFWADYVSQKSACEIHFFGKPYPAYFSMMARILSEKFSIHDLSKGCYVDDFVDNLEGCHLNISKILPKESGLAFDLPEDQLNLNSIDLVIRDIAH